MVTRQRRMLPDLLSQIDQLDNFLKRRQLEHHIWQLTRGKSASRRRWLPEERRYQFKKLTLQQWLQEE